VSVEQDAGLSIAQQPRQGSTPVQEPEMAQILAIMLDQVEWDGTRNLVLGCQRSNVPPYSGAGGI
jgi:hypothetical protein